MDQSSFLSIVSGWLLRWLLEAAVCEDATLSTDQSTNQIARFQAEECTAGRYQVASVG